MQKIKVRERSHAFSPFLDIVCENCAAGLNTTRKFFFNARCRPAFAFAIESKTNSTNNFFEKRKLLKRSIGPFVFDGQLKLLINNLAKQRARKAMAKEDTLA